jgi:DNA repair exonuclease SbcCD nuclease subunit
MKLIWTADWHICDQIPRCRIDEDWYGFLENLIQFIVDTANRKNAILGIGGDLFGRRSPNVSNYLLSMFIKKILQIKKGTRILAGNHDEYFHNFDYISKTSFGILDAFISSNENNGKLSYIDDLGTWYNFNEEIVNPNKEIIFLHRLVFENAKTIPPNVEASTANDLLNEFPNAKLILTGDNHGSFIYEKKGRRVCNPGSIYRGNAEQINYQPIMYFIDTDKDSIEIIELPDQGKMVTDSYIIEEKERTDRLDSFVERLKKDGNIELDFLSNIENALNKNKKMSKETIICIRELCEMEDIK